MPANGRRDLIRRLKVKRVGCKVGKYEYISVHVNLVIYFNNSK